MSDFVEVDLALGILDHQLVDRDGQNCGNVDELEIGGINGDSPEVTEILVGGNAWRTRGRLGRLLARFAGDAVHVPWQEVESLSSVVNFRLANAESRSRSVILPVLTPRSSDLVMRALPAVVNSSVGS